MTYRVITATLNARTAVHIGAGDGNDATDALIRRDAAGRPIIPGTAIAGALRSLLTRLAPGLGHKACQALQPSQPSPQTPEPSCVCPVCHLFGDVYPSDEQEASSEASRLLVFNASLVTDSSSLIRDGVGINRVTGAAARAGAVKYDMEVVPAGAKFTLRMELRGTDSDDEYLLAAALAEWQANRVWLGGRVARGLGAFKLGDDLKIVELDLNKQDNLMTFLHSSEPWQETAAVADNNWLDTRVKAIKINPGSEENKHLPVARRWISFEGTLQAQGPLLTNDTSQAGLSGFDHAPLLLQLGDWHHPLLTGAGLRGVIRSHAERIARTLITLSNSKEEPSKAAEWFQEHCPACDPNARRPGRGADKKDIPALESCDSILLYQAGKSTNQRVSPEELCLGCRLFGSSWAGSRLVVEDAPYAGSTPPTLKMLDFVAIDRFTGGAAEHFKFDALALWKPSFALRLHLDNPEDWELGWLALVLRDLAEGWLSVGYGAAKGFGQVTLTDWQIKYGYLSDENALEFMREPEITQEGVYKVITGNPNQADVWLKQAEIWVRQFHKELLGKDGKEPFKRNEDLVLRRDDYFGQRNGLWVNELYPQEVTLP